MVPYLVLLLKLALLAPLALVNALVPVRLSLLLYSFF